MKYKRFSKMKKSILMGASGSLLAGVLLMGGGTAVYAADSADVLDHVPPTHVARTGIAGMHLMHRWNSRPKAGNLATKLGLDKTKIKEELKAGKTLKQILQENGIVPDQLEKAFKGQ